ncbi:MAG: hypothetical protein WAV07_08160 [Candidatus Contendobacter sp.]
MTKKLLALAAVGEAAVGLALLIDPPIVAKLLLGIGQLAGAGLVIARVTGIALIGLGVSCWPGSTAFAGMLTYGVVLTLYLAGLGLGGAFVGVLLWPAVALHAVVVLLLVWTWRDERRTQATHKAQ